MNHYCNSRNVISSSYHDLSCAFSPAPFFNVRKQAQEKRAQRFIELT